MSDGSKANGCTGIRPASKPFLIHGTSTHLRRRSSTDEFISAAATETFTVWMLSPEFCNGSLLLATSFMPPRQLRTILSTSVAGTAIFTRLMQRRARRNGVSKPVKIRTSVINRAFNLHPRSSTELFMLVVEMDISMLSMPRPVVNVGTIQRTKGGLIARRQSVAAWSTPERRMATGSSRLMRKQGG